MIGLGLTLVVVVLLLPEGIAGAVARVRRGRGALTKG
jgi:hypothetical protein